MEAALFAVQISCLNERVDLQLHGCLVSYVPFTVAIKTECGGNNKQHNRGQQPNFLNEMAVLGETLLL